MQLMVTFNTDHKDLLSPLNTYHTENENDLATRKERGDNGTSLGLRHVCRLHLSWVVNSVQ